MTSDPLLVSMAAGAPHAAEQQLLDIDGTVFVTLGLFLLMLFLLKPLLWTPYLKVRQERSTRIEGYREDAERMDKEAEARFEKIQAELAETRRQGAGELAMARAEAQGREQTITAEANAKAQATLKEAGEKLEQAMAREKASLRSRAEALGREAASQVLGRSVS